MSSSVFLIIAGILSLIGGVAAWVNPMAAGLTVDLLAGWFFAFSGFLTIFSSFRGFQGAVRWNTFVLGLIYLGLGYLLLAHPMAGSISIAVLCGVLLFLVGAFRLIGALTFFEGALRWTVALSGALSIILALIIFANFPQSAVTTLGLLFAIELISNGIAMLCWNRSIRA